MVAAIIARSQAWSRLFFDQFLAKPFKIPSSSHLIRKVWGSSPTPPVTDGYYSFPGKYRHLIGPTTARELLADVEREREMEREKRRAAGLDTADIDAEENEDVMGVTPFIERLERRSKDPRYLKALEEPTYSDPFEFDEFESMNATRKRIELNMKKSERYAELWNYFLKAVTPEEVFARMDKIKSFEKRHFPVSPEMRVFGELLNRLENAKTIKEKFIFQVKLNRAMRMISCKAKFNPDNPTNYGVIERFRGELSGEYPEQDAFEKEMKSRVDADENDDTEFNDMKEKDDDFLQKIEAIDKQLEEKLAVLDHTFGRKGKILEEEIRNLAEERNALTEKRRMPRYRKGFIVHVLNVNRTSRVTEGGRVVRYTVLLACGNMNGVVGFAKGKGSTVPVAMQKADEKCFQNLHYFERYESHTVPHTILATYKRTKVYIWPAKVGVGIVAGSVVRSVMQLGGFFDVKSKIIGSRNPHNAIKAVFKALDSIETPRDIQQKFGRTVVEPRLLPF